MFTGSFGRWLFPQEQSLSKIIRRLENFSASRTYRSNSLIQVYMSVSASNGPSPVEYFIQGTVDAGTGT